MMSPNPLAWTFRQRFAAGFLVCVGLMSYALYAQHGLGLEPCPLCIFQRVAVIALGLVFLAGWLAGPRPGPVRVGAGLLGLVAAGVGAGVAGRHVWLQSLPADEVPACSMMSLDYMREAFGIGEVIRRVFTGSGECAEIDWSFLGLSMPGWTLIAFVALGVWAILAGVHRR